MRKRLTQELKPDALKFIEDHSTPICITDLAKHLGVSWSTARQILMELLLEGEVDCQRTTTSSFFWKKRGENKNEKSS
ncbi:hypothetical protein J7K27_07080 [Candidatus Bathyarchaeota archaeon]|nr:hypothetical protein [Candidatus Bathyarchaeota archaeon]